VFSEVVSRTGVTQLLKDWRFARYEPNAPILEPSKTPCFEGLCHQAGADKNSQAVITTALL
jgi:hypothetical protein